MGKVNIAIFDKNKYFKYGLEIALKEVFIAYGIEVFFTGIDKANIVLMSPEGGGGINFCHTRSLSKSPLSVPIYISILSVSSSSFSLDCVFESGRLIRRDSVSKITTSIISLYMKPKVFIPHYCPRCRISLTLSEGRVCQYIILGYSQSRISKLLSISQKTVSCHKRSVMKKLDLKSDIELMRWLRRHMPD
ncbi:TPA: LuxR family transcriptional regulator [Serratia marcescens]|nr:LuxR family transcriptional regulator [Serratia marcescens]